jgi:hypothetical protein
MKLRPAAATFALLLAAGCSHAPQPVTHRAEPANTAATAGPKKAPAAAAAPVAHSSEAEPKAAAATSTSAAAAPAGAAPSAAAMPAAAAASLPKAISPLPPLAGNGSGPAAAGASNAAGVGAAGTAAPGAAAAKPSGTPAGSTAAGGAAAVRIPGPAAAGEAPRPAAGDPSLVVVDQPDYDPSSQLTLAQAAKAERERRAEAVPPRIVINNKTLHRYAKGGQLTVAEAKKKKDAASAPAGAAAGHGAGGAGAAAPRPATGRAAGGPAPGATGGAGSAEREHDERYWRGRALDIRERWRKAADRIKVLEQDVSEWRRRFYAQDDPWVRDGQIKPAWDRALVELRESRAAVVAAKQELADFQEEGRIAGALPGWLREGIDLEPKEEPPVDPTQAIETPIYKEPGPRR